MVSVFANAQTPLSDSAALRTYINANIKPNGTKAITGTHLNVSFNGILNTIKRGNSSGGSMWGVQTKMSDYFNSDVAVTYRKDNTLYNLVDNYTYETAIFTKVADPTGIVIDSVIYCKKAGTNEVFKRLLVNNTLNPEWYGLIGDGVTENGAKMPAMVTKINRYGAGYHLLFPAAKTFICSTPTVIPGNNFTLEGSDKFTSIIKSTTPSVINTDGSYAYSVMFAFGYNISKQCTIRNIRFETYDPGRVVIAGGQVTNLTIDNCTSNASLVDLQSGAYAKNLSINQYGNRDPYDSTTIDNLNYNVKITNNILENNRNISKGQGAITVGYTDGAIITNNFVTGYNQGIQWWGGDAASYQGLYPSKKWARHFNIGNNNVHSIYGGGIWGSNGENVDIGNNNVYDCLDVCIDAEGSSRVNIHGNVVENGKNGGITTFFDCQAVNVNGNTVTSNVTGSYLFQIYQAFQTMDNQDITVTGNTFTNTGTGYSFIGGDNARDLVLLGNTLVNTKIDAEANNYKTLEVSDNKLRFYNILPDSAAVINVAGYHTNARAYIRNNTVISLVAQPNGVSAIYVADGDYNTNNKAFIEYNHTIGFNRDIVVSAVSGNIGITPEFYVNNNILGNAHFERKENGSGKSRVILSDNKDGLNKPFPFAIPTAGKWDVGQKIEYVIPDAFGNTGAICTLQGIPGTWVLTGGLPTIILPEYADNATAIAAGLTSGKFYRTGDVIKQVH